MGWIPACAGMTDSMDISIRKAVCKSLGLNMFSDGLDSAKQLRRAAVATHFGYNAAKRFIDRKENHVIAKHH